MSLITSRLKNWKAILFGVGWGGGELVSNIIFCVNNSYAKQTYDRYEDMKQYHTKSNNVIITVI